MSIQEARSLGEQKAGRALDEQTFQQILDYTRHKAEANGKDDDYIPLLLVDEIKDHVIRENFNNAYRNAMEIEKEFLSMVERGEWSPCAKSACTILA